MVEPLNQLLDLETKLSILALNPCACDVCRQGAKFAKSELAKTAPSGAALLDLRQGTPEFAAAERQFRADEIIRLQAVYDIIALGRCLVTPLPPLPPPQTLTPIPELPAPGEWREQLEHYRKHAMKPRIEKLKSPRIPGSYIIK